MGVASGVVVVIVIEIEIVAQVWWWWCNVDSDEDDDKKIIYLGTYSTIGRSPSWRYLL